MLGIHGLEASLSLLADVGCDTIADVVLRNTSHTIDYINNNPDYELVTPAARAHAGIVSFRPRHRDATELHGRLQAAGVVCSLRSGAIRFSPHFHTPRDHLDRALALL